MDYDSFNCNIEETNTEMANYGAWSFVTVEGHSSNVVVRINSKNKKVGIINEEKMSDCVSSCSSSGDSFRDENDPSSLLEVIDDRNKQIVHLKRINYNQKLQLNYYLKNGLNSETVSTLGRTINLNIPEEYDSINFAMCRFNKVNNRKGRIIRTYEKLNSTENKIFHLLKKQECLLRKVTVDFLSSSAERNSSGANDCDPTKNENFVSYVVQLDVFSKLLATTLSVKREVEILKSYSKRLVAIEEDRNSLVDHIYQLPIEQRLNGSYLLSVERDKAKLCMEMSNIRNDQRMLKEKISKLNHEEEHLIQMAKELKAKSITLPEGSQTANLTKDEHRKLIQEIEELKTENCQLQEKLNLQQESLQALAHLETKIIQTEGKCAALQQQISLLSQQNKEQENELLKLRKLQIECNELLHMNEMLKSKLSKRRQLEDDVSEMRKSLRNFDMVKEERDMLKGQSEEYRIMKHLYSSMFENSSGADRSATGAHDGFRDFCNKIVKIKDMENEREQMKSQIDNLPSTLKQQDMQIKDLLGIVDQFGDYKKTNTENKSTGGSCFLDLAKKVAEKFNSPRLEQEIVVQNVIAEETPCEPEVSHPCSSNEALEAVFGADKVCHTSKILETGELLSQLNNHIETLEETTRGFCTTNLVDDTPSIASLTDPKEEDERPKSKLPVPKKVKSPRLEAQNSTLELQKLKDICSDGESNLRPSTTTKMNRVSEAGDKSSDVAETNISEKMNSNKSSIIDEFKEIQQQLGETLNQPISDDLRNNFKRLYTKIFGEPLGIDIESEVE